MSAFGAVLRKLRKQDGLTQSELGKALGISYSTVSMYERGEREPDFEMLEIIADYFNVSMDYLHDKETEKSPEAVAPTTRDSEREKKYEVIYDLFYNLSDEKKRLAVTGLQYLLSIPEDQLPEAVRYLKYLAESREN